MRARSKARSVGYRACRLNGNRIAVSKIGGLPGDHHLFQDLPNESIDSRFSVILKPIDVDDRELVGFWTDDVDGKAAIRVNCAGNRAVRQSACEGCLDFQFA